MSAAREVVAAEDVVDVDELLAERNAYRDALEAIRDVAQATLAALPDRPTVKRNAAAGPLLTLSGLAETALES